MVIEMQKGTSRTRCNRAVAGGDNSIDSLLMKLYKSKLGKEIKQLFDL